MILRIDHKLQDPIYLQIRDQIVEAIAQGELLPGDGLPSVRSLASDLGVNLHTVNKAYALLRDEGYLIMRGRSGASIAEAQQSAAPERLSEETERTAAALYRLALEYRARGGARDVFESIVRDQARRAWEEV